MRRPDLRNWEEITQNATETEYKKYEKNLKNIMKRSNRSPRRKF